MRKKEKASWGSLATCDVKLWRGHQDYLKALVKDDIWLLKNSTRVAHALTRWMHAHNNFFNNIYIC